MKSNIQIHQFEEQLRIKNYAQRSITDYCNNIREFYYYLSEEEYVFSADDIRSDHIKSYQLYMNTKVYKGKKLTQKSISTKLGAVKTFFKIMAGSNLIRNDLSSCVTLPQLPKCSVKNIPSAKEMCEFLDTVEPVSPITKRDRTILELLYSVGLRSSEIRRLKLSHLDMQERPLWIGKAKKGSDRLVPLGEWLVPLLDDYLQNARSEFAKNGTDLLFPSKNGREITKGNLRDIVKKYAERADMSKIISPHVFRSCTATHLLDSGADIRKVQLLLGHVDIKSTQVYLKQTYSSLKEAHFKYHPRQKDAA